MIPDLKALLFFIAMISLFLLWQGRKKDIVTHQAICKELDSVLKDKDYLAHLEYLESRKDEKKVFVYTYPMLHKIDR